MENGVKKFFIEMRGGGDFKTFLDKHDFKKLWNIQVLIEKLIFF